MCADSSRARPTEAFDFDGDYGAGYATLARQVIPAYEQLFELAFGLLDQRVSGAGTILVAGCGTGIEIVTLGRLAPGWRFIGVDPSSQMLDLARDAVAAAGIGDRVELRQGFVSDVAEDEFDGATLFNVLHFLEDDGAKESLLRDVATRLRPGGRVVIIDLYGNSTSERFARTLDLWGRFMTVRGLVGEEQERFRQRIDEGIRWVDRARIEQLMDMAGLSNIEMFFQALLYGGWIGEA